MSLFGENEHTCFPTKYNNRRTISIVTEQFTPQQVLANDREVGTPTIRDAASEVSSALYKSQSQTEWSRPCSDSCPTLWNETYVKFLLVPCATELQWIIFKPFLFNRSSSKLLNRAHNLLKKKITTCPLISHLFPFFFVSISFCKEKKCWCKCWFFVC